MNMVMISEEQGLWRSGRGTLEAMHKPRFEERGERSSIRRKKSRQEISSCGVSELPALWLLQCRLAWYGFRSVKVGQLRQLSEHTLFVDLLQTCGTILCTVEIDPRSGAIRRPQGHTLVRLVASLGQAELDARPPGGSADS
jgi:hypothetical protein